MENSQKSKSSLPRRTSGDWSLESAMYKELVDVSKDQTLHLKRQHDEWLRTKQIVLKKEANEVKKHSSPSKPGRVALQGHGQPLQPMYATQYKDQQWPQVQYANEEAGLFAELDAPSDRQA